MRLRQLSALLCASAFALFAVGCSDSGTPSSGGDGGPTPDMSSGDGTTPQPDGDTPQPDGSTPQPDLATTSALQAVMNKLLIPKASTEYAHDIDGNGTPDNRLGGIIAVILGLPGVNVDLQGQVDQQLSSGSLLLLFDLMAQSLQNDSASSMDIGQGTDTDGNPTNNFSGSAELSFATGTPPVKVTGSITNGKLVAEGEVSIAVPLGTTPAIVTLKKGYVEADVSASGMANGKVAGAIPMDQVNNVLIPAIATMMNDPTLDPTIKNIFDANKDGTISAAELSGNFLISFLLAPDVDTDGQGGPDALSLGVGFTAVPCVLK